MAVKYQTIYSSLGAQVLMTSLVKKPVLDSVAVIFSPEASKFKKLKALISLWRAYQAIDKFPRPTIENTWHPNSHNLVRLRDWLTTSARLGSHRESFIERIMNLAIVIYDFDPPWRWVMDSAREKMGEMEWKARGYGDDWQDWYDWWKDDQ